MIQAVFWKVFLSVPFWEGQIYFEGAVEIPIISFCEFQPLWHIKALLVNGNDGIYLTYNGTDVYTLKNVYMNKVLW